jgi:hypothetical protein
LGQKRCVGRSATPHVAQRNRAARRWAVDTGK